jgi:hypothetical protein
MKMNTLATTVYSIIILFLVGAGGRLMAETTTTINGVGFGDYYYNLKNNTPAEESRNAFQFRRLYFTVENNLNADMKVRFRLEAKHDDYGKKTAITPFVKHAYIEWSNLIPAHKFIIGIQETNGFKNSEELWGYRPVEKTIMDLNGISSSADMGIGLKGDLGTKAHHWLTILNGTGYNSAEVDKFKKVGYAFWLTPVKGLIVEGYADYEPQKPKDGQTAEAPSGSKDYQASKGYYTWKAFVGYEMSHLSLGAEYFTRTNKESGISNPVTEGDKLAGFDNADVKKTGYSVFGSWITPLPKLKVFGRDDFFDANAEDNVYTKFISGKLTSGVDNEVSLIIAGLDYIPRAGVHFIPNIMMKSYSDSGLKSDITARVTLYFKYDSGKIITN